MTQSRPPQPRRRGAILVLVALLLPAFAMMAAFAIDVAWMQLVRTELRTATDAASRAGAKTLSLQQNEALARTAAIDAASRNAVAGSPMQLAPADVQFGSSVQSGSGKFVFSAGGRPLNAVHVDGRRTAGSPGGPVDLFFGSLIGQRTFEPAHAATSTTLDRDICLVLDRSGSMSGQKIRDLKTAVAAFLAELNLTFPREQVALVSYSTTSRIDQQLTFDYAAIRSDVNAFNASGFTAIGLALQDGLRAIEGPSRRPFALPTVVLMTDGNHNTGVEPIVPARVASSRDITVHTVTFGGDADFARMRAVANETGGRHFHAATGADLTNVFREIARTLPVLMTE
ncbi:von Willebrand factor type A domain protein [Pirellulimonas nuda]|uniref:von Willebrand factor type A domain protein n=1 Tax=Pirellulimonas nuda TaxID=2528009 RepID=A0A518D9P9_9BACT|nr:vWA domain-containing protein [Pirellulimonas nuda]QDU88163.1 von Willebrand factor type A domain protein [Pirellulimonas nuda]